MKIHFAETERALIYTLNLETELSANDFRQELDAENWQVEQYKNVNGRDGGRRFTINGSGRYDSKSSLDLLRGSILKQLFSHVLSEEFKLQWLSEMVKNPAFCKLWGSSSVQDIANYTILQANYVLDKPGARISMHLDNRLLLSTGMIYLNQSSDATKPNQATVFYTDRDRSNPITITPAFASGWAAANTHNSWHEGFNKSEEKRYSLLLGMSINVAQIGERK
jgi:hypothetical protein